MPNNDSDRNIENLYHKFEDEIFQLAMNRVAEDEGRFFHAENEGLKNDSSYDLSRVMLKKIEQNLHIQIKKHNAHRFSLKKVAVLLVAIITLFSTLLSVQAFRIRILNFFMEIQSQYTSFQVKDHPDNVDTNQLIVDWRNSYVPTYIPDGYELDSIEQHESSKRILLINKQNKNSTILYAQLNSFLNSMLDSENAESFKKIDLNGHEGTLIEKASVITLIWEMDKKLFMIQSNKAIDTDELIKIAKGVKFIK